MDPLALMIGKLQHRAQITREAFPHRNVVSYFELMAGYLQQVCSAGRQGLPLAWVGLFTPVEIFYAMGIVPFVVEYFAMLLVSETDCTPYLDAAAGYGLPADTCSLHKLVMGMALKKALPPPDLLITTAQTCDTTLKSFECLQNHYGCATFFIDFPYADTTAAFAYYRDELKALMAFLTSTTGRILEPSRLESTVRASYVAGRHFHRINQLKRRVPAPVSFREALRHFGLHLLMPGLAACSDYFAMAVQEAERRAEDNHSRARQRHRLLWLYVPVPFGRLYEWMERSHGAYVVMDTMSYSADSTGDFRDPLDYLTRKAFDQFITAQFCRPIETFQQDVIRMIREYRIDACIYLAHIGCKQGCGAISMVKAAVRDACAVPFLTLNCDIADPTVVSDRQLQERLEGFMEMLDLHREDREVLG
jgi:benzoyl-CoA reductase/2-hydroxyglutaryl-CoA dehydratase subunit BcrC/BadD/HgdB